LRAQEGGANSHDPGSDATTRLDACEHRCRLRRDAQRAHAMVAANRNELARDERVQMEVPVGVDVIERKPGLPVTLELRPDLGPQLRPQRLAAGDLDAEPEEIAAQTARAIDEIGDPVRRQHRRAVYQDDMQPDPKPRQIAGAPHGIGRSGAIHHEACGAHDAMPMRRLDRRVDLLGQAEVIRRDDQVLQGALSRR
jgi:hypothetical protein